MIIREFKRPDIKRVLEIETEAFNDPYPPSILIDIYNLGAGFLVAQQDNIVVGYIIFWIRYEDEGHIISLAVDKKYRKKGVGIELVEYAINIFTKCNVREIKLEVRIGNKGAREFYEKMGFEEKEILKNYYEDGENAVIMRKEVKET
jgi:ribosomal-protein-alanine N-acetyltransferase